VGADSLNAASAATVALYEAVASAQPRADPETPASHTESAASAASGSPLNPP
jgi:hypothetical protein